MDLDGCVGWGWVEEEGEKKEKRVSLAERLKWVIEGKASPPIQSNGPHRSAYRDASWIHQVILDSDKFMIITLVSFRSFIGVVVHAFL